MQILIDGILVGFLLSIMAGPIFVTLVQLGVERGIRAGMALSFGVFLSDCFYFYLIFQGVEFFSMYPNFELYVGVTGGLILALFGLFSIMIKYKPPQEIEISARTYGGYFLKGIAINIFNPFVFLLWTTISQDMISRGFGLEQQLFYFFSIMGTVVILDFLKLVLAKSIRPYLRPRHLSKVSKIAGIGLIIFGIILIVRVLGY